MPRNVAEALWVRHAVRSSQRQQLVYLLRGWGASWVDVATALQQRYRINARIALRYAHRWSQRRAADEWNRR
jgi:hypothetical protein